MKEAKIIINGIELDDSHSLTIRVALSNFLTDLYKNGLGDDEHGKAMKDLYILRIREIFKAMRGE